MKHAQIHGGRRKQRDSAWPGGVEGNTGEECFPEGRWDSLTQFILIRGVLESDFIL